MRSRVTLEQRLEVGAESRHCAIVETSWVKRVRAHGARGQRRPGSGRRRGLSVPSQPLFSSSTVQVIRVSQTGILRAIYRGSQVFWELFSFEIAFEGLTFTVNIFGDIRKVAFGALVSTCSCVCVSSLVAPNSEHRGRLNLSVLPLSQNDNLQRLCSDSNRALFS